MILLCEVFSYLSVSFPIRYSITSYGSKEHNFTALNSISNLNIVSLKLSSELVIVNWSSVNERVEIKFALLRLCEQNSKVAVHCLKSLSM